MVFACVASLPCVLPAPEPVVEMLPAARARIGARFVDFKRLGDVDKSSGKPAYSGVWSTSLVNYSGYEIYEVTVRFYIKNKLGKRLHHSDHRISAFTDSVLGYKGTFLPAGTTSLRIPATIPADKFGLGNINTMGIVGAKVFAKPDLKVPGHLFSFIRMNSPEEVVKQFASDPSLSKVKSPDGWTPMLFAAESENPALLKFLVKQGGKLSARSKSGVGVMQCVALSGSESTLNYLLKAKFNINDRGGDGRTALHHAAAHAPEAVELLLRKKADVNAKDKVGERPIAKAARSRIPPILEILIRNKASLANDNPSGLGPLQIAATNNDVESIKVFVESGVNLNLASKPTLLTALHFAIAAQSGEAIRWLLSYGANLYAKDSKGVTPYDIAMKIGGKRYAEILINTSKKAAEMRRKGS